MVGSDAECLLTDVKTWRFAEISRVQVCTVIMLYVAARIQAKKRGLRAIKIYFLGEHDY